MSGLRAGFRVFWPLARSRRGKNGERSSDALLTESSKHSTVLHTLCTFLNTAVVERLTLQTGHRTRP